MYPQNEFNQSPAHAFSQQTALGNQAAPTQTGIATRATELQRETGDLLELVGNLRAALGISTPIEQQKTSNPSSLAELLLGTRISITLACNDIREVIAHLNS